jgi:hypothetical protein
MKYFLLFKKNGEIEENTIKCKTFETPQNFNFTDYIKYDNYIILYNGNTDEDLNKTVFYFTEDKFKGEIALIKIDKNNSIKNLKIDDYFKKLTKTIQETCKNNSLETNSHSDSDSDSDFNLSLYGSILLKDPFEF